MMQLIGTYKLTQLGSLALGLTLLCSCTKNTAQVETAGTAAPIKTETVAEANTTSKRLPDTSATSVQFDQHYHADHDDKNAPKATSKPSAPISFSSGYDGSSVSGQVEEFHVELASLSGGDLTIKIHSQDNILLSGEINESFTLEAHETVSIPVSVYPHGEGKFYLDIVTQLNNAGRSMGKAFSQAIYVGDWKAQEAKKTALKQSTISETPDGNKVIALPATETIRKPKP